MTAPVRTTLIFGLLSGLCMILLTSVLAIFPVWPVALKIYILLNLVLYSILLCYWTNTKFTALAFPLMLVTGIALWPSSFLGFILAALLVFSWIRSGICCKATPLKKISAELITVIGGAGFLVFWRPETPLAVPVAAWFFILFQSLYFIIVPRVQAKPATDTRDPFERACREMERILSDSDIR